MIFGDVLDYKTAYERYRTMHIYIIPTIPQESDTYLLVTLIEKALERNIVGIVDRKANVFNTISMLQSNLNYTKCYHPKPPILIRNLGPQDDYCEVYQFPCCGKEVIIGDGVPSMDRADGCCKKD